MLAWVIVKDFFTVVFQKMMDLSRVYVKIVSKCQICIFRFKFIITIDIVTLGNFGDYIFLNCPTIIISKLTIHYTIYILHFAFK